MEDAEEFDEKILLKNFNKPITAFRLGPKENIENRPIKLKFQDENEKSSFLKRTNTLRARQIFCRLDVAKETRDKEYQLMEKIRAPERKMITAIHNIVFAI